MGTHANGNAKANTETPRLWLLIPCAGSGSRAGAPGPKQYQTIAGKAMVLHTLQTFAAVGRLHCIALVVAAGDHFFDQHPGAFKVLPCGGATRAASVTNGLIALKEQGALDADWVLVHDAARCLVSPAQVNALIDACLGDAVGGLLALPLADTLKQAVAGRVQDTLARTDKWLAQTPQMFRLGLLLEALQRCGDQVTDEASAIEAMGLQPLLVAASAHNFKVTYAEDFALAEALLLARAST